MDYIELKKLSERLRIKNICQRAHLFSLAYRDIQASLKSTNFHRWGICRDFAWPSHWGDIKALGTDSITFSNEDGRMVVRFNNGEV